MLMNKVFVPSLEALKITLMLLTVINWTKGSRNAIRYSSSGMRLYVEREKSIDMISTNGNGKLRQFGESCNETHKCDFNNWLICERISNDTITSSLTSLNLNMENESGTNETKMKGEGRCVCRDGDDLFFEVDSNRCVARVGTTCRRILNVNNEESSSGLDVPFVGIQNVSYPLVQLQANGNDNRVVAKRIGCVHNAICDATPIFSPRCRCHKGYYSTEQGTCQMQKTSPEPCSSSEECILLLSCIDNVCQCKNSLIFDKRENRCAIPNGAPCETLEQTQNQRTAMKFQYCTSNSLCNLLTKTCQCKNGPASFSSDGSCRPVHGELCSKQDPCADSYVCHNGLCTCKYPFHQQYDQQTKECRSLVHGPCLEKSTIFNCTENAHCSNSPAGNFKECQCNSGYFDTKEGKCLKGYETECQHDKECYPNLLCIDFRCQCKDKLQIFNSETRGCEGIVGSRCSLDQTPYTDPHQNHLSPHSSSSLSCFPTAKCVSTSFDRSYGRCECTYPYTANSDRICVPTANDTFIVD